MKKLLSLFLLLPFAQSVWAQETSSVKFRFPIADSDRHLIASVPIMGFDHDGSTDGDKTQCTNFGGAMFPFCYDGHRGTDFSLIGGFPVMDRGSAKVVAAAAGKVIEVIDGNFDRCQFDLGSKDVTCFDNPMRANLVTIKHSDGTKTKYLHLKKGSVVVRVGQRVRCGQLLGLVGSSGHSTLPHLHFTVISNGKRVDPYGGDYSQDYNYWHNSFDVDGLPSGQCRPNRLPAPIECRWETVQNAALCGEEAMTDAFLCGVEAVECGTEIITCGTEMVTSGAQCGYDHVTSAAQCGVNLITDIFECAARGFGLINSCEVPRSCDVARTCEVDLTCEVAKYCNEAQTCNVAKTCQINSCNRNGPPRSLRLRPRS